jgi:DNA (cytosine-5)-methyltransferase 1
VDAVAAARPRLLDLFCGAGGAGMGYHRAGFDVTGVDIKPQPRYPFEFMQADAMTYPPDGFDAIHASPPCQDHMRSPTWNATAHGTGWMLAATRDRLRASGLPWVLENVPGADVRADYRLCGCQFGLRVRSERWFETSWQAFDLMPPHDHSGEVLNRFRTMHGPYFRRTGHVPTRREVAIAMGIDWMSGSEHQQAIPPAYTEHIGRALLEHLAAERAA